MVRVSLDTLGCKLNQAETEALANQLVEAGYKLVSSPEKADIYILNTCTVTQTADAKSRHWLRQAHRRNPHALVVATGCYAQRVPEELAQIEGVDFVLGNDEKPDLLRRLEESGYLNQPAFVTGGLAAGFPEFRTRAFIKIQDGCTNFCAYCIVPLVRGGEVSLPAGQVVAEVGHRVANEYKEVVLTGTRVGSYHCDGVTLMGLLDKILAETDVTRLRLSSLQPHEISQELIELWNDKRLCPHFHLSLQSGSDRVLKLMNRRYTTSEYEKAVSLIRSAIPDVAITTDVIVGFPGETDEDFETSYEFCRRLGFARIHVFPYSPRSGIQAVQLPQQINDRIKRERSQKMLALARESSQNFNRQFLGKTVLVLWEKQTDGIWSGLTDNYIKVYAESDDGLTNKLLPAKLVKTKGDGVWGKI